MCGQAVYARAEERKLIHTCTMPHICSAFSGTTIIAVTETKHLQRKLFATWSPGSDDMHGDEDYDVHHRTELRRAPGAVRLDQVRMEKGIEKPTITNF